MAEIVNLRRARKLKARAAKEALAAENRARHGLGKDERLRREAEEEAARRRHDRHRLTRDGDGAD